MKDKEKVVEIDMQVKEKIGFASILYDRLYVINKAFDNTDISGVMKANKCYGKSTVLCKTVVGN